MRDLVFADVKGLHGDIEADQTVVIVVGLALPYTLQDVFCEEAVVVALFLSSGLCGGRSRQDVDAAPVKSLFQMILHTAFEKVLADRSAETAIQDQRHLLAGVIVNQPA